MRCNQWFICVCFVYTACMATATHAIPGENIWDLTATDGMQGDGFGFSVALNHQRALIGAPRDDDGGDNAGAAYMYDLQTGDELFKIQASDPTTKYQFGRSVAMNENYAVVGAPHIEDNGDPRSSPGAAYVFDTTTGSEIYRLTASNNTSNTRFGTSVAIDGQYAVVGAPRFPFQTDGAAYIFDLGTGEELFRLAPPGPGQGESFGQAVAIDGDTVVVGAYIDSVKAYRSGAAYIFDRVTGEYRFRLTAADADSYDHFGYSVAVSSGLALIGAWGDDEVESNSGAVYVFDTSTGQQLAKLKPTVNPGQAWFGYSVAASDQTIIVGAPGSSPQRAHVLDLGTGAFRFALYEGGSAPAFGSSVAIAGNTGLVGAEIREVAHLFDVTNIDGDINLDGYIGITDLNFVLSNWNKNAGFGNPQIGDLTGDGFVGIEDLNIVLGNWNAGTPPAIGTVPEPGSVTVLALGTAGMLRLRSGSLRAEARHAGGIYE